MRGLHPPTPLGTSGSNRSLPRDRNDGGLTSRAARGLTGDSFPSEDALLMPAPEAGRAATSPGQTSSRLRAGRRSGALRYRFLPSVGIEIARNLWRRKLRNSLTLSGVVIGVLALTILGSLSENASAQLQGGQALLSDHVTVQAANSAGSSLISPSTINGIRRQKGITAAYGSVAMPADEIPSPLGSQANVVGLSTGELDRLHSRLPISQGRQLRAGDQTVVVVGADAALREKLRVGSTLHLPVPPSGQTAHYGWTFRVVGIMSRTLGPPDDWILAPLSQTQHLLAQSLPKTGAQPPPGQIFNGVDAYGPASGLDAAAKRIQNDTPGIQAISPKESEQIFKSVASTYATLTWGSALVALLVGGLSVANTMIMSGAERVREIGIKKSVGAQMGRVLAEFLTESVVLGLLGGIVGFLVGWGITALLNDLSVSGQNAPLFLITPRLVILSLLFSTIVGAVAGFLPALRAARLDPVRALRSQT